METIHQVIAVGRRKKSKRTTDALITDSMERLSWSGQRYWM